MLRKLLQIMHLSCGHSHLSRPVASAVAARSGSGDWDAVASGAAHYVVCLDCGKKFGYDWSAMRVLWQ